MKTIVPLIGSGQPAKALTLSPQNIINMFEVQKDASNWMKNINVPTNVKYDRVLYGTPGTGLYLHLPANAEVRGGLYANNNFYVVCGSVLYQVGTGASIVVVGSLNTSSGFVSIISSTTQLALDDGTNGYYVAFSDNILHTITDVNFISTNYLTYNNGRAHFVVPASNTIAMSVTNDFSNWTYSVTGNSLRQQTQGDSQRVMSIAGIQKNLYIFGQQETEIWATSTDPSNPYVPLPGALIPYGCVLTRTIIDINGIPIWASINKQGQGMLISIANNVATTLLDEHSTYQLQQVITDTGCYAYSFQIMDHIFYAITSPANHKTFLYDLLTTRFITWSSWYQTGVDGGGHPIYAQGQHLSNGIFAVFDNKLIVGDYRANGNLLYIDLNTYTDYSAGSDNSIYRQIISPIFEQLRKRITIYSIEVDYDRGNDTATTPLWTIAMSKNGGATYTITKTVSPGGTGTYLNRIKSNCWGQSRDTVITIYHNDPGFVCIMALLVELEVDDDDQMLGQQK